MIRHLFLEHFKSFDRAEIQLKPLTILTGLNSSGKSSVIQAIRMLAQYQLTKNPVLENHGYSYELRKAPHEHFTISVSGDGSYTLNIHAKPDEEDIVQGEGELSVKCMYLSADRLGPHSYLPMNVSRLSSGVGTHGEYVIDFLDRNAGKSIDKNLIHKDSSDETLRDNTESWLHEISPHIKFEFSANPSHSNSFSTFNSFRSTNVGFGLSYTLPVIVSALGVHLTDNNILMMENPEAHLHPKGQTEMGRLLARAACVGTQVVIETHSDHFIDGVRLAVKNGVISHNDCIIHFFGLVDGVTKIETIELNKSGKISKWPEGFFDQSMINKSELIDLD